MKKLFLTDINTEKRNELIKKNQKLENKLLEDLYEYNMFNQEEEGRELLGKDQYKYIDIKDHYSSFYLVLKDWSKFIDNINIDYLYNDDAIELYNNIIKKRDTLYNMDSYSDEFYDMDAEIEDDCKKLLKYCEDQLLEYEKNINIDDAIQYADEMDQLNDYYIEETEDGFCDNVIRLDVAFTETFI